jgi:hypothetical protein
VPSDETPVSNDEYPRSNNDKGARSEHYNDYKLVGLSGSAVENCFTKPESLAERNRRAAALRTGDSQLCLPLWPEAVRGLPNPIARSALFTARNHRSPRATLQNALIASLNGIEVRYTGIELRQIDADVFLQLLHLARGLPLGSPVDFIAHRLLMDLGWTRSSESYERLLACIRRLTASNVEIVFGYEGSLRRFGGGLVQRYAAEERVEGRRKRWRIWFEPQIIQLFQPYAYSRLLWEERQHLKDLAKRLHALYATHREPFPLKVETLMGLCGSDCAELATFRRQLRRSLGELKACGFLRDWRIDRRDLVHVERAARPSGSHSEKAAETVG